MDGEHPDEAEAVAPRPPPPHRANPRLVVDVHFALIGNKHRQLYRCNECRAATDDPLGHAEWHVNGTTRWSWMHSTHTETIALRPPIEGS